MAGKHSQAVQYRIDDSSLKELEQLTSSIVKSLTMMNSIFKRRHAVVKRLEAHYKNTDSVEIPSSDVEILRWCVRNEKRLLDRIRPGFFHNGKKFLALYPRITEALTKNKRLLKNINKPSLSKASKIQLSYLPHLKKILVLFEKDLDRLETRIAKEEEFLAHRSTATAKDLFGMWNDELMIANQYQQHLSSMVTVVDKLKQLGIIKLSLSGFLALSSSLFSNPDPAYPDGVTIAVLGYVASFVLLLHGLGDLITVSFSTQRDDVKELKDLRSKG